MLGNLAEGLRNGRREGWLLARPINDRSALGKCFDEHDTERPGVGRWFQRADRSLRGVVGWRCRSS